MTSTSESPSEVASEALEYHPLCGTAVAALILGVLSAAAIFHPLLCVLPLAGVVVGGVALKQIRDSQGELSGRNLAVLGLMLALMFGMAAPARAITRRQWLAARAEAFATQYFELLRQGHGEAAHQLSIEPLRRKPLTATLPASYANDPESQRQYENFVKVQPAAALLTTPDKVTIEHRQTTVESLEDEDLAKVIYDVTYPDGGVTALRTITVLIRRQHPRTQREEQWQIMGTAGER